MKKWKIKSNQIKSNLFKFSPFPVLILLVNHIFVGAIPPEPPPPGYASGAHATEIICSRAKRAAKTENGCIN